MGRLTTGGRLLIGILAGCVCAAAQTGGSVSDVVAMVRSAVRVKESDSQLAKRLHKVKLAESLDGRAVEELESAGAGPKALAELERMSEASRSLPLPVAAPEFGHPPAPSPDEWGRVLKGASAMAYGYLKSLPDFICDEQVRRYDDSRAGWQLRDTLGIRLSFSSWREDYKLLTVNGRPTFQPYESVGGAISQGEFGSLMGEIFERGSQGDFRWDHWTTLRKRPAHVFSFRVKLENSRYTIAFGDRLRQQTTHTGQHGFVYVDDETHRIVRIVSIADSIPRDFPVRYSSTLLDYDFTDIGGRQFLLPLRAVIRLGSDTVQTRNEVEFHGYRKFGTESSISFDEVAPEDQTVKH